MSMLDLFKLDGKVALVTGAAGLIGRNHCRALAEAGAVVIACDLDEAAAIGVASAITHGLTNDDATLRSSPEARVLGRGLDVTNPGSLTALRDELLHRYGHIDVLVNNAAINDMVENPTLAAELSKFENYPLTLWKRVLDVNVTGVFLCCQVFGAAMAERQAGSIINIASTYGVVAPDQSIYRTPDGEQPYYKSIAYPASKGAVVMITKFLSTYWGARNVRVNTLSPGGVQNNQPAHFVENYSAKTPLGRMAAPEDYMGALVFLASDASAYMTGHNLVVDGGWTAW